MQGLGQLGACGGGYDQRHVVFIALAFQEGRCALVVGDDDAGRLMFEQLFNCVVTGDVSQAVNVFQCNRDSGKQQHADRD